MVELRERSAVRWKEREATSDFEERQIMEAETFFLLIDSGSSLSENWQVLIDKRRVT